MAATTKQTRTHNAPVKQPTVLSLLGTSVSLTTLPVAAVARPADHRHEDESEQRAQTEQEAHVLLGVAGLEQHGRDVGEAGARHDLHAAHDGVQQEHLHQCERALREHLSPGARPGPALVVVVVLLMVVVVPASRHQSRRGANVQHDSGH